MAVPERQNPILTTFQVQRAPSLRDPRPSVVFLDSFAIAHITAPGFPQRIHAKSCLIKDSKGFSSGSRVGRWYFLIRSLSSYNRSLLPPRKSLNDTSYKQCGACLRSVVFPDFLTRTFVRTRHDFLTYNRLASSTLFDAV